MTHSSPPLRGWSFEPFEGTLTLVNNVCIVRRIVERHGGRVWIESAEGKGTAVYFTLDDATTVGLSAKLPGRKTDKKIAAVERG